jgi:hypothetical protein
MRRSRKAPTRRQKPAYGATKRRAGVQQPREHVDAELGGGGSGAARADQRSNTK